MVQALYDDLIPHWSKIQAGLKDKQPLAFPISLIGLPHAHGGLGAPYPFTKLDTMPGHNIPPLPSVLYYGGPAVLKGQRSEMSDDWIQHISERLPEIQCTINAAALRTTMLQMSYMPLIKAKLRSRPLKDLKK